MQSCKTDKSSYCIMKRNLLFILSVFICTLSKSVAQQTDAIHLSAQQIEQNKRLWIPGKFSQMQVDGIGNIYVTENGLLKKFAPNGDSMSVYNDVRKYGNPTNIDVSNPLKTIVFYKNYATLITLDNLLSQRAALNLRKNQLMNVKAVTISYDNNFWVFDEQDYKLKKINEDGKTELESNDLRLSFSSAPQIKSLYDFGMYVYLQDDVNGLIVMDKYGAYIQSLPLKNLGKISFSDKFIYGFNGKEIVKFNPINGKTQMILLPKTFEDIIDIQIINSGIFVWTKTGVHALTYQE